MLDKRLYFVYFNGMLQTIESGAVLVVVFTVRVCTGTGTKRTKFVFLRRTDRFTLSRKFQNGFVLFLDFRPSSGVTMI